MSSAAVRASLDPRANNFNLLRLVAASAVIFSHASDISRGEPDVLVDWMGYSGGWIAVSAFFSISGMLIYKSIVKSRSVKDFLVARCLRILPGLWAMLLVTVLALGLGSSIVDFGRWLVDPEVFKYVAGNSVLYAPQYLLPDTFESNPLPGVVNGSLWTLRFEFTCYLAVLVLFLLGAYRSGRTFGAMCLAYVALYVGFLLVASARGDLHDALFDGSDMAKMHRLSLAFVLGMVVGRYSDRLRPKWWGVGICAGLSWLTYGTMLFPTALITLIAATVFWFAFAQHRWLLPTRGWRDYSYGIYIYAFPVQQCVEQLAPSLPPMINALASFAITIPLAALSWHLIEGPALKMKSRLTGAA